MEDKDRMRRGEGSGGKDKERRGENAAKYPLKNCPQS